MNAIFSIYFFCSYDYMIFYMNYASITTKCQKRIRKGPKKCHVYAKKNYLHPNHDAYEDNFLNLYQ